MSTTTESRLHLHRAARVVDGAGIDATPGALLRRGAEVIAAGTPASIGVPADAVIEDHADSVILPALGNAHAHLDLTAIEPAPFDGDFARWLARILDWRRDFGLEGAKRSLRLGAELTLAGGVAMVGDILGSPAREQGVELLERAGLSGVAFVEVFGVGKGEAAALAAVERIRQLARTSDSGEAGGDRLRLRVGIQPHAPQTTTSRVLESALRSGMPLSIHLAESEAEIEYCTRGTGPMRTLLERSGAIERTQGDGAAAAAIPSEHPVDWFCDLVRAVDRVAGTEAPTRLAVHLEQMLDHHCERLRELGVAAITCPRSSRYFGRRGMPWRRLRDAGVTVALGTDGRLCLDTPDRISTLDEMRCLWRDAGAALESTLPLATVCVARALGAPEAPFTLRPGVKPGVLRVECGADPREGALRSNAAPTWIVHPARTRAAVSRAGSA